MLAFGLGTPAQSAFWNKWLHKSPAWQHNAMLMNDHEQLAQKLVLWLTITQTDKPLPAQTLITFANANSGWPELYVLDKQIENSIKISGLHADQIIAWFGKHPPQKTEAFNAYMRALQRRHAEKQEHDALAQFWANAKLTRKETRALAARYRRLLSPQMQHDRLENLLWSDRFAEAEYMFPYVGEKGRRLAKARIALARRSRDASRLVRRIPRAERSDPGLIYARVRWQRMEKHDTGAYLLLRQEPANPPHPGLWWRERDILARRAIEKKDFSRAFDLINDSKVKSGDHYITKEWTLGWLDLDFLGRPRPAYMHFEKFYSVAESAISCARGAYWLSRAAEKMGWRKTARKWARTATQYPSTFYGQLAYEAFYKKPENAANFHDAPVSADDIHDFDANELVRVIRLLNKAGLVEEADPFFYKLLYTSETRPDFTLLARLAYQVKRPQFAVMANMRMQQMLGTSMYPEGYPLLPALSTGHHDDALIHAVVHRESMFDADIESPAGALGLMQLMPRTAQVIARRIGIRYNREALTDPRYNIKLGTAYLQELLNDYNGSYPLAIAAYNAGPRNVDIWLQEFGDPRHKNISIIKWIEEIPIYETRNYIQRVLETYYIYQLRLGQPPKTILALK